MTATIAPLKTNEAIAQALASAARQAIDCQDACNASGVGIAYGRHWQAICDASNLASKGTSWKNQHPISFMFAFKLLSLNGHEPMQLENQYYWAENQCRLIVATVAASPSTVPDYTPYAE
jgi:hypothetical protein